MHFLIVGSIDRVYDINLTSYDLSTNKECPDNDSKLYLMVKFQLWRYKSELPLDPLWPGVVGPDWVLPVCQIDLLKTYSHLKGYPYDLK